MINSVIFSDCMWCCNEEIQITVLDSKSVKRFDQFSNFIGLYVALQ